MRLIQLILTILGCIVYKYIAQAFLGYSHDDLISNFIDNKLLPNYEKKWIYLLWTSRLTSPYLTKIFSSASMLCFIENNPLIAIIIDIHYIQYIERIIVNLINS